MDGCTKKKFNIGYTNEIKIKALVNVSLIFDKRDEEEDRQKCKNAKIILNTRKKKRGHLQASATLDEWSHTV